MLVDYDQEHLPTYGKTNDQDELLDTVITSTNPHPINECLDYIFEIQSMEQNDSDSSIEPIEIEMNENHDELVQHEAVQV